MPSAWVAFLSRCQRYRCGQEQLTFFALAKRAGFELDWVPQSSLHPDFQTDGAADDPAECRGLAGGVHVCVMRLAAAVH